MKLLTTLLALTLVAPIFAAPKPNILFIMSDDLRDFGGAFSPQVAKTPNLDRLRARGVTFERAYVQYPVCNPSRTSLLTGLRAEETGITGNGTFFREKLPEIVTLPQLLRQNGWATQSFGKIYHAGNTGESPREVWLDKGKSWDHAETLLASVPNAKTKGEVRNLTGGKLPWCEIGIMDGPDEDQPDGQTATAAIRAVETLNGAGKPWMVAAGFHRPHDPFHAPRKYFEMYPKEKLTLYRDPADISKAAPLAITGAWVEEFAKLSDDDKREFLRAYLAGVSFMDAQLGRLLDTLDKHKLWDNTVVVFMGDHGYHLGERGWWNKSTLFERACRAPLIVAAPGVKGGQRSRALLEFVDVYPTLAEFCGVAAPHKLAGQSFRAALQNPAAPHKSAAFTLVSRGPKTYGQSVRTARWRLTRWSDGAIELFDEENDPEETRDVAAQPENAALIAELKKQLDTLPPWPNGIQRQARKIAGWTVQIDERLLEADRAATEKALTLVKKQLEDIVATVPATAVEKLRQVPLYFSPPYEKSGQRAEYHPSAGWLKNNGRDPVMARAVEFTNVKIFEAEARRMPALALHELAHAYHDQILGNGHAGIKAAYEAAKASGKYDKVERVRGDGRPNAVDKAYAMTDPQEYFAETSEAFFGRNDFYPFTRDELQKFDPEMHALLEKVWGAKP